MCRADDSKVGNSLSSENSRGLGKLRLKTFPWQQLSSLLFSMLSCQGFFYLPNLKHRNLHFIIHLRKD
uniref:Uncharacterized protein n=1 Tax=Arion vulgaris TaxID=1028688 RepID=A0A0B7BIC5_9EUPU